MGVTERIWAALTSMIKLEDKVTRQSDAIKTQQMKLELDRARNSTGNGAGDWFGAGNAYSSEALARFVAAIIWERIASMARVSRRGDGEFTVSSSR